MALKGHKAWNRGIPQTAEWKQRQSERMIGSSSASLRGKLGAQKRWDGHVKTESPKIKTKGLWTISHDPKIQLQKKRFRNQRYKAIKKGAIGSHTFDQWLELKLKFNFMCPCCKKFEPTIKLSEDHIVPLSLGGSDYIENIQPLCVQCNTRKHTQIISFLPINTENNVLGC